MKTNGAKRRQGKAVLADAQWLMIAECLSLSDREVQVVQCVFDDKTEAAAALELSISSHTVHSHLTRVYRKLGVRTRCELVVRVFAEYLFLASSEGNGKVMRGSTNGATAGSSQASQSRNESASTTW